MSAPATAIIAYDLDFHRHVAKLNPHAADAKDWFSDPKHIEETAFRNGSLQGAYFIIAARALGLDCGPMSGFDNAGVDREFFAGTAIKSNFLCNVGYGDTGAFGAARPSTFVRRSVPDRLSTTVRILAVDTAFGACSAAVLQDDAVLARRFSVMERGHAEALAPMVEAVMIEAQIGFEALDRLAVTVGPGTFTGQRVGLAFMRGLRLALKKPLTGVTSLAAMTAQARAEAGAEHAAAIHDARRGEVYLEIDSDGAHLIRFDDAPAALEDLNGRVALAGTARNAWQNFR